MESFDTGYDPFTGRFLSADVYLSTGQGVLGCNPYCYCGNNPVNHVDPTGQFGSEIWEFAKTAVAEIGKAIEVMSPAYSGCGGAALVDGPLPLGDIAGLAGAALLTVGAIGYGIYQAVQAPAISIPKAKDDFHCYEVNNVAQYMVNSINSFSDYLGVAAHKSLIMPSNTDDCLIIAARTTNKWCLLDDYHYAVYLHDDIWADKPGTHQARFGRIHSDGKGWGFYKSDTIYIIVKKMRRYRGEIR